MTKALANAIQRIEDKLKIHHGEGDPLQAMEDDLRTFGADEIIISTLPEGRSNWLERGVVDGARERFDVPVTHVVVDLERDQIHESPAPPAAEP